jgi:hypothetical protein
MGENDLNCNCCSSCPADCKTEAEPTTEMPLEVSEMPPEETLEQEQSKDPTAEFDLSRKSRQDAIKGAMDIVRRANSGAKLDRKDIAKALRNLTAHTVLLDELVVTMLQEMYRVVQTVAQNEVNLFTFRANLKAVVMGITRKGVITDTELADIFTKEVLPEMLPKEEEETGMTEEVEEETT